MTLFTFHMFRADGAPVALETMDFASPETAMDHARTILEAHRSAQTVTICEDDEEIASVIRFEG